METRYISLEECIKDLREYEKTAFSGLTVIGCISRIKRIPPSDVVPAPRWISVKERLPEDRHSVLVYCPYNKCIYTAYYEDFNDKWYYFGGGSRIQVYYTVSHWMPLPEPPEKGGGENE